MEDDLKTTTANENSADSDVLSEEDEFLQGLVERLQEKVENETVRYLKVRIQLFCFKYMKCST